MIVPILSQVNLSRLAITLILVSAVSFLAPSTLLADEMPDAEYKLIQQADELFAKQQWALAATAYDEITQANPKNGRAWFRQGYSYHADRQLNKAIIAHRHAAQFPQQRVLSLYNLACAFSLKKDAALAMSALQEAVASGYNNASQLDRDSDFSYVRESQAFQDILSKLRKNAKNISRPPGYGQFDFWIGDWDVYNKNGKKVGHNLIERQLNGFLLMENWTSVTGGTGKSINYFDPTDGLWKQNWVSADGGIVRYVGRVEDGAMHFTGESISPNGKKELADVRLTPLPDGRLHHFIKHTKDNGKTWYTYFDGIYVRRK